MNKELEDRINKRLLIPKELIGYEPIMTSKQWERIVELLEAKRYRQFYQTSTWKKVREDILNIYKECVLCKMEGKITTHDNRLKSGEYRGLQVHHMKEIEYKSNWDYCLTPVINNKANLIPLCHKHHNLIHDKEKKFIKAENKFINEEKW